MTCTHFKFSSLLFLLLFWNRNKGLEIIAELIPFNGPNNLFNIYA